MPDTNAGVPRLFSPWGGFVQFTISATDYPVFHIVPGTLRAAWPFRSKHTVFDRGELDAVLEGDREPVRITFTIRYTDGPGAGELYTLLGGTGASGEAKFTTLQFRIPRGPGSANYDRWTFEDCALVEQPTIEEQADGEVHVTLSFITKDADPSPTAV